MLAALATSHVKEDYEADYCYEEHPPRYWSYHVGQQRVLLAGGGGGGRSHINRLDEPLLRRDFQHIIELEAGAGGLLLGGPVVSLPPPLPASHHKEDKEPHEGYEGQAAHNWPHYQEQLFRLGGLSITRGTLPALSALAPVGSLSITVRHTYSIVKAQTTLATRIRYLAVLATEALRLSVTEAVVRADGVITAPSVLTRCLLETFIDVLITVVATMTSVAAVAGEATAMAQVDAETVVAAGSTRALVRLLLALGPLEAGLALTSETC